MKTRSPLFIARETSVSQKSRGISGRLKAKGNVYAASVRIGSVNTFPARGSSGTI